jgi:hypothetical protein
MQQDEVALIKAIESGDTDLRISSQSESHCSVYRSTTSSKETSIGKVFQGD